MKVAPRCCSRCWPPRRGRMSNGQHGSIAHNRPPEFAAPAHLRPRRVRGGPQPERRANRSLEARPAITVKMGPQGDSREASGRTARSRTPAELQAGALHIRSTVADIGSNEERFWFWVTNKKDRSVYVCDYADLSSTSLAVTYQPDWIVQAMGLTPITPDEAAQIKSGPDHRRERRL